MIAAFGDIAPSGRCLLCGEVHLVAVKTDERGRVLLLGGTAYTGVGICRACVQKILDPHFRRMGLPRP